ncbi:Maf family protein [Pusillimonas sp. NJUB218]|uniref:Maf family protein n=1 Tax=Pusillimonas sp. NJUB218 TaxID=2023230 RepID=UPI000F4B0D0F|nr:hypothetical protein CHR62_02610 [Pusillimonas sp. NJUB218]
MPTALPTVRANHYSHFLTAERTLSPLSAPEVQVYCTSAEPWGKAGGYGIQGKASMFIQRIAGSYSGVMGLPVFETAQLLKAHGLLTQPVAVQE